MVAANNSATRARSGTRGTAIAAMSTARTELHTTMTERPGYRLARSARNRLPITQGR